MMATVAQSVIEIQKQFVPFGCAKEITALLQQFISGVIFSFYHLIQLAISENVCAKLIFRY